MWQQGGGDKGGAVRAVTPAPAFTAANNTQTFEVQRFAAQPQVLTP